MTAWREQAACRDADHDLFHPIPQRRDGVIARQQRELVDDTIATWCHPCRVRGDCLDAYLALVTDYTTAAGGIWGGFWFHGDGRLGDYRMADLDRLRAARARITSHQPTEATA